MVKKKELLKEIGYEKEQTKKPKEEKAVTTKLVKVNSSADKNSQLREY